MFRNARLLTAIAAAALALPVAAQAPPMKGEADRTGQETPVKKKSAEELAKEKATKEKVRADAVKSGTKGEADKKGQQTPVVAKTPEQLAKEKADKAKRGVTPEEQAKAAKQSPGS
jgi:hypothetical protein